MGVLILQTVAYVASLVAHQSTAPSNDQATETITIEPSAIIEFPESVHGPFAGIIDCQVSESGDAAYVLLMINTVNLWHLAVRFWPEILGAITGLCFLIGLWRFIQVWRKPRLEGKPHCRKCNHCLFGIESHACPECGVVLARKKPIMGRTFRRRLAPTLVLSVLVPALYGTMHVAGVPRTGPVSDWFCIESTWLYDELYDRDVINMNTYGD